MRKGPGARPCSLPGRGPQGAALPAQGPGDRGLCLPSTVGGGVRGLACIPSSPTSSLLTCGDPEQRNSLMLTSLHGLHVGTGRGLLLRVACLCS